MYKNSGEERNHQVVGCGCGLSDCRKQVGEPIPMCVEESGITVVPNKKNELIFMSLVTGWSVCMDYRR